MKNSKEYLKHILIETDFILSNSKNLTFKKFDEDETLKRAFTRSLEIIGEAVKNVDEKLKEGYPLVAWKNIAKTRDRLIHHYFGIDYYIIWDIIQKEIKKLDQAINEILSNESNGDK